MSGKLQLGWELGEIVFGKLGSVIKNNAPGLASKAGNTLKFSILPEATMAGHIAKTANLADETIDTFNLGAQVVETAWWLNSVSSASGLVTDGLQIWNTTTSSGGNEWTVSENLDQAGLKAISLALNTASIKSKNNIFKFGLRAAGLATGTVNNGLEMVMKSADGGATELDRWAFMGNFGSVYTTENGFRKSSFQPIVRYYEQRDRNMGYDYGRAGLKGELYFDNPRFNKDLTTT